MDSVSVISLLGESNGIRIIISLNRRVDLFAANQSNFQGMGFTINDYSTTCIY